MKNLSSSTKLFAMLGIAIAVFFFLRSEDSPSRQKTKPKAKPKATAKLPDGITVEDFRKPFDRLNESPKNAFMPLVARMGTGANNVALSPDMLPAELTGGEPGWVFTGVAEVNGVSSALLENRNTGVGEFLTSGQSWKKLKVSTIGPSSLTVIGPNGQSRTLKLSFFEGGMANAQGEIGVKPLNPAISGQIGGARLQLEPGRTQPNNQSNLGNEVSNEGQ